MDVSMSVIPLGLEPKTYCLEGSCSIQLSYGTSKSAAKLLLFWLTEKRMCQNEAFQAYLYLSISD